MIFFLHLDPFGAERRFGAPPLPPGLPANSLETGGAEVGLEELGSAVEEFGGDFGVVYTDPVGRGDLRTLISA